MTNEEKILEMLAEIKATQAEHSELLKAHSELLETLDARSLKSAVLLETEVARDVHLIYEGHSEINRKLGTLATKDQVEELSSDMDVIKDVVTRHSSDISKLKKAQ